MQQHLPLSMLLITYFQHPPLYLWRYLPKCWRFNLLVLASFSHRIGLQRHSKSWTPPAHLSNIQTYLQHTHRILNSALTAHLLHRFDSLDQVHLPQKYWLFTKKNVSSSLSYPKQWYFSSVTWQAFDFVARDTPFQDEIERHPKSRGCMPVSLRICVWSVSEWIAACDSVRPDIFGTCVSLATALTSNIATSKEKNAKAHSQISVLTSLSFQKSHLTNLISGTPTTDHNQTDPPYA